MIAREIYFLSKLSGVPCDQFRHFLFNVKYPDPIVLLPKEIALYTVPDNFTWLITRINYRSIPSVTDITTQPDWRSDDYDATGLSKLYINANGAPVVSVSNTAYGLLNRPLLLAFQGKTQVGFEVIRPLGSLPATFTINMSVHGYLTSPQAYTCFSNNLTQVEAVYS